MSKSWKKRLRKRLRYDVVMDKILKFLDENSWKIRIVRIVPDDKEIGCFGVADSKKKEIIIDIRSDIVSTLIHECVHALIYDDKMSYEQDEKSTLIIEEFIKDRLTEEHLLRLVNFLLHSDRLLAKNFPEVYESTPEKDKLFTLNKLLKR